MNLILYAFSGKEAEPVTGNKLIIDSTKESVEVDIKSGNILIENYPVTIPKINYSDEDLKSQASECMDRLYEAILNGNESFEMVSHDLFFPEYFEDYPFRIAYDSEDNSLISAEGIILCDESFDSEIYIVMSYGSFYTDISIPIHVEPDKETLEKVKTERLINKIEALLGDENAMIHASENYVINLPGDVDGNSIDYYYSGKQKNPIYLILGPVIVISLFIGFKKDEKDSKKKSDEMILDEYPGMVQKMALYLISGMTVRNIWILLYEEAERKNGCSNPLYQKMRISANELRSGVLETDVYKRFGERLKIPEIVRFTALLSQNIRKGGSRLSEQLMEESRAAFEKRKQRIIERGSQAGTKLLFPMMLLLIDIMVMIIIPAFWNI